MHARELHEACSAQNPGLPTAVPDFCSTTQSGDSVCSVSQSALRGHCSTGPGDGFFGGDDHVQPAQRVAVIANTSFTIADRNISSSLFLLFEMGDIEKLLSTLTGTMSA